MATEETKQVGIEWFADFWNPDIYYASRDGESELEALKGLVESEAVEEGGDDDAGLEDWTLTPIFMCAVSGKAADEHFHGEFESGWVTASPLLPDARPFWKAAR